MSYLLGDVVQSLGARQLGVDLGGLAVGDDCPPDRRLLSRRARRQLAAQSVLGIRLRRLKRECFK